MGPSADDLDGFDRATVYDDRTIVRILVRRTSDPAYPSGWRYTFHYGGSPPAPKHSTTERSAATTTPTKPRKATNYTPPRTRTR